MRGIKPAFTLAEVLITLGIIGVVAAMTMPSLISKHREKETVVRMKKVYSTIQQAYFSAVSEYGTPDNWDLIAETDIEGARNILELILTFKQLSLNTMQKGYSHTNG